MVKCELENEMKDIDDGDEVKSDSDASDKDVDSFSSDDEEVGNAALGGYSTAGKYKDILVHGEDELRNIIDVSLNHDDLNKFHSNSGILLDLVSRLKRHQEITPMFVDGSPFLIDGLSLLTCVLQDSNYCTYNGGQTLHLVYLCERIIELICRKGGTCEVIFFRDKSIFFQDIPEYLVALSTLKIHLMKNTDFAVFEMDSIFSSQFHDHIAEVHPCLIIMDFSFIDSFERYLEEKQADVAERLFNYYELFALALGLYCVDICHIELKNNMLHSFVSTVHLKDYRVKMTRFFSLFSKQCLNQYSSIKTTKLYDQQTNGNNKIPIRKCLAIQVAKMLFESKDSALAIQNIELVKLYLFYNAVLECLPLSCRCFNYTIKFTHDITLITKKILNFIGICLQNYSISNLDCSLVADLWHGNLFVDVIFCVVNLIEKLNVGTKLDLLYKELLKYFNKLTGISLEAYPIVSNDLKEKLNETLKANNLSDFKFIVLKEVQNSFSNQKSDTVIDSNQLIQPLNDLVKHFCSDIVPVYYTCNLSEYLKDISKLNIVYEEKYHWHCLKKLTDDFDRIKDSNKENTNLPMRKQMRNKAKHAHYMAVYGSNIEGNCLEHEPIIVCKQKEITSKKKQKKLNKPTTSKKGMKIIEENKMNKQKEFLEVEKQKFDRFLNTYKANKNLWHGDEKNLELINQLLLNIHSDEYTGKLLYYKAELLFQLWLHECKQVEDKVIDLTHFKELFLVIRSLLRCSKTNKSLLIDKQSKKLGKILCSIGFKSIAEKWNLPVDNEQCSVSPVKLSYIRFQLVHLGPDLERRVEGQVDDRVTGFIPDPWQKKLFDIIDKGQSALIVAPTSSGKTYASYYCMKKILKESNDGRVVYVAPTKALVNQVAATIYARFKDKKMPDGKTVYGVFTRDYRQYATESQILITVPECLELLLMSPRRYSWVKSLKYVIFDEIHCLAGQGGGITWERCLMLIQCPFLALSATIQNPREFWTWMQSVETFKRNINPSIGSQVHLIVHMDRHNDLVRHIYGKDRKLHHIHPYAYLTDHVMSVHKGMPPHISLDPRETIQLFDVMSSVSSNDSRVSEFDPDKYFSCSDTGYIFRQDVKEYGKKLSDVLETWFKEKRGLFHDTIKRLYEPLSRHESGTKDINYFIDNIVQFVKNLESKNMLPALIFSYDRSICETMGESLSDYYTESEDKYWSSQKRPMPRVVYDIGYGDCGEQSSKGKQVASRYVSGFQETKLTSGKKDNRLKRDLSELFPLGLTECDTKFSLRGPWRMDSKDLQFIERRLSGLFSWNDSKINGLRRGIGVHHGGIVTKLRNSVEMLFRSKFLNVVFATGTLALGIHMPCKTVVVMGDSPFLNTLEYHQMSGRSGRRGFDKTGDVIFFGLDTDKMRVLMTSKLPRIIGNFPLTVSTILRLLVLINDVNEKKKKTEESYNATLNRALTVLNEGLLYQTEKNLKDQMKHFVLFSCQLLMIQRLIDAECKPILMAGLVTHLHYYEPGNLAFTYLLRTGVLAKLCSFNSEGKVSSEACHNVVKLVCQLFTRIPFKNSTRKYTNSLVKLPPLPDYLTKALEQYNKEVKTVFRHYFEGFSRHITTTMGEDNKLPLSGKVFEGKYNLNELFVSDEEQNPTFEMIIAGRSKRNLICSAFAGLSGQTDENLYSQTSLISNIRHQVVTDCKIVPLVDLDMPLNGYAYDFYRHGIFQSIIEDNGLRCGHDFTMLKDFLLVIKTIVTSLSELGMTLKGKNLENESDENNLNSCVVETFRRVENDYRVLFMKAYG